MTTPFDPDSIPQTGFDPIAFWQEHKTKVIIYGALLVIAVAGLMYHRISSERQLQQARQAYAQAGAADDYRHVIQEFPHSIVAGNASLLLAEKLRDGKNYDDAIAVLQAMIDTQPNHPLVDAAWLSLASTYNTEGKADQALDTYRQIATKFADRFSAPMALFSIAEVLKTEGKLDDAKVAYENVKTQFPDSYFASEAVEKLQLLKK
jgi:TolA-binding protein